MQTEFITLIRSVMQSQGWSRRDVVRRMGYKNVSKGLRRLDAWLQGDGYPNGAQCSPLAEALSVTVDTLVDVILRAQQHDRDQRRRRRAQDPHYYLTIRIIAAVYNRLTLPVDMTRETAMEHGVETATRTGLRCCLDMPTSETVWFEQDGTYTIRKDAAPPYMSVGGKRFVLSVS